MRHFKAAFMSMIIASLCALTHAATPPNIAGYWKLDESNKYATSTLDETETNNGVVHGKVKFNVDGVNGSSKAAQFEGSGKYIEIPHHDDYLLDSGTIVFWFWPDKTDARYGLFTKDSTNFDTGGHISIFLESDDRVKVRLQSTSSSYTIYSTTKVDKEEWHHIAVAFGPGGLELYLDGALEGINAYEGGLGDTSGGTGNFEPVVLGANSWASDNLNDTPVQDYFPGRIDEVGILSDRWDSSTIADLYAQTGPGTSKDLGEFAGPTTYYVRKRGLDTNDGLTLGTAFRTIQQAVNHCTRPGSTIYVGPGSYEETIAIGTGVGVNAIDGTELSPNSIIADPGGIYTNDDPGDVEINGDGSDKYGINMVSRVNWVIDGFKFRDQKDFNIYASNSGLSILNCDLEVPSMYSIYATTTGDLMIADCDFVRSTTSGHVIWVTPMSTTTATSVIITRNDATLKDNLYLSTKFHLGYSYSNGQTNGGGNSNNNRYNYGIIVYGWGRPLVDRIEISNNQLSDFYLGIYCGLYSTASTGSFVSNNTVTGSFYSIYSFSYYTQSTYLINNIIDTCYLGLISYAYRGQTPVISGLLEHNITYNMAAYNRPFEFDIIQSNPSFTDAAAGEFSLQRGSLAIDAGVWANAPSTDIDGRSRPTDGDGDGIARIDLGAYELVTNPTRLKVVQWREISGHRDMSGE